MSLFAPLILAAATGNFFEMDYSPDATEKAGWFAAMPEDAGQYTRTLIPRCTPEGESCYEIVQLPGRDADGDFYWGWSDRFALEIPKYSEVRYFRWRLWYSPDTDFAGLEQGESVPAPIRNKLLILGDGSSVPDSRFILQTDGDPRQGVTFVLQKDGGVDAAASPRFRRMGVWMAMQLRVRYSSAPNIPDGGYDLWIDDDDIRSPTVTRSRIVMNPPDARMMRMGYMNNALAKGGVHTFRISDFEVGPAYADRWSR